MTEQSQQIVAEVDRFPEWARIRMRDAVLEIADVYSLLVQRGPYPRHQCAPELKETAIPQADEGADVISLAERRARRA